MDTRNSLYTENLNKKVDGIELVSPIDLARSLALYIKVQNDSTGVVSNISIKYIEDYDGKSVYKRFGKTFDLMNEMFKRNSVDATGIRWVFRAVAKKWQRKFPSTQKDMVYLNRMVIDISHEYMKRIKEVVARKNLLNKFKMAIKKYLHLAFELGYNEPSLCVKELASRHKIAKYVLSGDFPLLLLPFLPEVEDAIKSSYENYEMVDDWNMLKERYFNHKDNYYLLAIEIKNVCPKNIRNFSDYFDTIYSDTYYKAMLGKGNN